MRRSLGRTLLQLLIRANPYDPGKTDDLVCDLCTAMPKPTMTQIFTFKIRGGGKFTDGAPLTARMSLANWNEIIFPRNGVISARPEQFRHGRQGRGHRSDDRDFFV